MYFCKLTFLGFFAEKCFFFHLQSGLLEITEWEHCTLYEGLSQSVLLRFRQENINQLRLRRV